MNKIKKLWKEISVFGIVLVVFLGLLAYRKITHVELTTISTEKLEAKLEDKDNFVVVVGSDNDNTTVGYQDICIKYLEKNRGDTIYYVNLANEKDATKYIQETFDTSDGTIPSTFVIKNGKVTKQKTGSLSYYRLAQLFK